MRRHGATVVGHDVRELVFRSIAMCQNAEYQMRALALGSFGPLTLGETKLAAAINLSPGPLSRGVSRGAPGRRLVVVFCGPVAARTTSTTAATTRTASTAIMRPIPSHVPQPRGTRLATARRSGCSMSGSLAATSTKASTSLAGTCLADANDPHPGRRVEDYP